MGFRNIYFAKEKEKTIYYFILEIGHSMFP